MHVDQSERAQVRQRVGPLVRAVLLVAGASMLGLGAWGFLVPGSFADFIDFAPYNEHLIRDAGAFQIGIGVTTLLALAVPDAVLVALVGFVAAAGLHTVSHLVDRHAGGHGYDAPGLAVLAALGVAGCATRLREVRR